MQRHLHCRFRSLSDFLGIRSRVRILYICASDIYHHHISILHKSLQDMFAYNLVKNTSGRLVTGGNDKLEQANLSAVYTVTNKAVYVCAFLYYMSRAGFMRCPKANFQRLFSCAGKTRLLIIFSGFRHSICISYFDLWCATYYQQNPTHQTESKRSEQT